MPAKVQRIDPNANDADSVRVFCSRAELTKIPCGAEAGCQYMEECPIDNPILDALLDIPGVTNVTLHRYTATVQKAPTYSWEETQASVFRLLTSLNETSLETLVERES